MSGDRVLLARRDALPADHPLLDIPHDHRLHGELSTLNRSSNDAA
jgi:hypothetical protein